MGPRPGHPPEDLVPLQRLQARLGEVVDRSAAGDEQAVVARVNELLARHPVRPGISGHDAAHRRQVKSRS